MITPVLAPAPLQVRTLEVSLEIVGMLMTSVIDVYYYYYYYYYDFYYDDYYYCDDY